MSSYVVSTCRLHPCWLICPVYVSLLIFVSPSIALGQGFMRVCIYLYTRNLETHFWELFLFSTCVICNLIQWIYNHNPNLHLLHMSIYVSLFLCLLACFLFFVCLLACIPISLCLFCVCVCVGGVCLCCMWWMKHAPYLQAASKKGIDQQILGDQPFCEVRSFPYPFLQNHAQLLSQIRILFCTLLWATPFGCGYVYFSVPCFGPHFLGVEMYTFPLCVDILCMLYIVKVFHALWMMDIHDQVATPP